MSFLNDFLETIYDVLFKPNQAMHVIAQTQKIKQALLLFFFSSLMPPWAAYIVLKDVLGASFFTIAFFIQIGLYLICWFLFAAVLGAIAELYGGRGSIISLFATLGFASLPRIVITPFWVCISFMSEPFKSVFTSAAGFVVLLWMLFLYIEALKASYKLSTSTAILTLFTPIIFLIGLSIILFLYAGALLANLPHSF
ncbi:YIP1 family protein [Selenomonadales bacterium OttesenSCG-928-I06]|nr:YIP1 family protein [Selenomonadales bacterium OttesenSCG-928-I06]